METAVFIGLIVAMVIAAMKTHKEERITYIRPGKYDWEN